MHSVQGQTGQLARVMYVGPVSFAEGVWVGLDTALSAAGRHAGSVDNVKFYYTCVDGHGLFLRPEKLTMLWAEVCLFYIRYALCIVSLILLPSYSLRNISCCLCITLMRVNHSITFAHLRLRHLPSLNITQGNCNIGDKNWSVCVLLCTCVCVCVCVFTPLA